MTDGAALLAAIITHPDDDTVRLVYADWLDENAASDADRDRAEFIRLQCELALWGGWPEPDADDRHRFGELLARVGQLAGYRVDEWLPGRPPALLSAWYPEPPDPGSTFSWWHRGFLAVVRLTAAEWAAHAGRLTWHPSEGRPCPVTAHPLRVVRLAPPAAPAPGWLAAAVRRLAGYRQPGADTPAVGELAARWPWLTFEPSGLGT